MAKKIICIVFNIVTYMFTIMIKRVKDCANERANTSPYGDDNWHHLAYEPWFGPST